MRNQGSAGFADRTADFPFEKGEVTGAAKLRLVPDTKAFDLAVFFSDRAPLIYRDQLGGQYAAEPYSGAAPRRVRGACRFRCRRPTPIWRASRPTANSTSCTTAALRANRWIRIQMTGIKTLKLAQDAQVEIKAGSLYRRQVYAGVPLFFDTGGRHRRRRPHHLAQRADPERNQPADQHRLQLRGGAAAIRLLPHDLDLERARVCNSSRTCWEWLRWARAMARAVSSLWITTSSSPSPAAR